MLSIHAGKILLVFSRMVGFPAYILISLPIVMPILIASLTSIGMSMVNSYRKDSVRVGESIYLFKDLG